MQFNGSSSNVIPKTKKAIAKSREPSNIGATGIVIICGTGHDIT